VVARHGDAGRLNPTHPDPSSARVPPATSAAAPGSAQDARTRPVTNHTAPVDAGSCAAVETAGDADPRAGPRHTDDITGGSASGAGIAGMAGSVGAGRPGGSQVRDLGRKQGERDASQTADRRHKRLLTTWVLVASGTMRWQGAAQFS
jgi:hypothetical protein